MPHQIFQIVHCGKGPSSPVQPHCQSDYPQLGLWRGGGSEKKRGAKTLTFLKCCMKLAIDLQMLSFRTHYLPNISGYSSWTRFFPDCLLTLEIWTLFEHFWLRLLPYDYLMTTLWNSTIKILILIFFLIDHSLFWLFKTFLLPFTFQIPLVIFLDLDPFWFSLSFLNFWNSIFSSVLH